MASGLQCPGCGHVHPAGLPEIARGDAVFRCYGCYRPLSVPEGWTGRPPRPAPELAPTTEDAPRGAGTRDARSARLASRRGSTLTRPVRGPSDGGVATQMSSVVTAAGQAPGAPVVTPGADGVEPPGRAARRSAAEAVGGPIRVLVWAAAFVVGLLVTAFVLRKVGLVDVDTVIDIYAGSGPARFGILLVLLPLWALVSATIAHFGLEVLAKRRRQKHR